MLFEIARKIFLVILLFACSLCFHLFASTDSADLTEMDKRLAPLRKALITDAFNSASIVTNVGTGTTIPYYHDPIQKGLMVCQAEAKVLEPTSEQSILYTPNLSSCQLVIIRNKKTQRTGMYLLDQFFNFCSVPETLDTYGSRDQLTAYVVINQTYFNDKGEGVFRGIYGENGIDEYLRSIANLFEEQGVIPTISKLIVDSEIIANLLEKFLPSNAHDKVLLSRMAKDSPSKLCVDKHTGQLYWWSLSLTRITHATTSIEMYDGAFAAKLQQIEITITERSRKKSFYALNEMC